VVPSAALAHIVRDEDHGFADPPLERRELALQIPA